MTTNMDEESLHPYSASTSSFPLPVKVTHTTTDNNINYYHHVDTIDRSVTTIGNVGNLDKRVINHIKNVINIPKSEVPTIHDWQLPPPTEPFMGRDRELEAIKECFGVGNTGDAEVPNLKRNVFVLYGLGGSGKTQLALKFAELHGSWFWKTFYIDASNSSLLEADLASMARCFEAGKTAKDALTVLLTQRKNWLLIFDNADDPDLPLGQYFPTGNHGCIMITTRNKDCTIYAVQSNIHVTDLCAKDAIDLLLKVSMCSLEEAQEQERHEAATLVKELGYLPLAIAQAGVWIRRNSSIAEYLQLFRERRKEILRNGNNIQDKNRPVYIIWDLSYKRLGASAKDFLDICVFLHSKRIPKTLFENGIPRLLDPSLELKLDNEDPPEQQVESWKATLLGHWVTDGKFDLIKFNDTVSELSSYSFVTDFNHPTSLYSIHELVHHWIRDNLTEERSLITRTVVTRLFCRSIPLGDSSSDYQKRHLLLPHAVAICNMPAQDLEINPGDMSNIARIYDEGGRWQMAKDLYAKTVQIMKTLTGDPKHPDTLPPMVSLAAVCRKLGNLDEAEKLQLEILEVNKELFGATNPGTLSAMNNLANTYGSQKRFAEAEKLLVEVREIRVRVLGKDNPQTLTSTINLATTYYNQRRWAESEELMVEAVEIRKNKLGKDDLGTLSAMHNLANTYNEQRRCAEAEEIHLYVVETRKRILGDDHPSTLTSIINLTRVYNYQKQWAKFEELLVEVVERCKNILGKDHQVTLLAMTDLANAYAGQNRQPEAEKLRIEVLDICKRIFHKNHPQTLSAMDKLALTYYKQGRLDEAEKLQIDLIEGSKGLLGNDHHSTLLAMGSLGITYRDQGRRVEARQLQAQVVEKLKNVLGKAHPDVRFYESTLRRMGPPHKRMVSTVAQLLKQIRYPSGNR